MTTVLHVTSVWGGGVQTAIESIIDSVGGGVSHSVLCREVDLHNENLRENFFVKSKNPLIFLLQAAIFVRANRFDVVHLHSSHAGLLRPLLWGRTVVYSPHCFAFERSDISGFFRFAIKQVERALSRIGRIWAISAWEVRLAESLGAKSVIQGNNFAIMPMAKSRTAMPGTKTVAMIGRLCPQKDPGYFKALSNKVRKLTSARFVWIGDGEEQHKLDLRGAEIEVTGWLTPRAYSCRLAEVDLVLHTALWEGSPMSLLEAASAGLPIVVRKIASLQALGYVVLPEDLDQAAQVVAAHLTNSVNRQAAIAVSERITLENSQRALIESISMAYGFPK